MSSDPPIQQPDPVLEQLVAYLDGELDAEESALVEQRLADDVSFRQRLQQLEQTWDLLDHLPRSHVRGTFTQTTVEMVAVKAEDDFKQQRSDGNVRRTVGWMAATAFALVAAIAGYLIVERAVTADNRQLLKDLIVIENYDLYLHADSIDFLLQLEKEELFTEDLTDDEVAETL